MIIHILVGFTHPTGTIMRIYLVGLCGFMVACLSTYRVEGQDDPPADLVVRGAHVVTLDSGSRTAQAVAIRGDRIVAVGTDEEIRARIGPATMVVDGGG